MLPTLVVIMKTKSEHAFFYSQFLIYFPSSLIKQAPFNLDPCVIGPNLYLFFLLDELVC